MSYFSELLPKINDIPKSYIKNFEDDLKVAFELFDKFEEEFQHGKSKAREKTQRGKDTTIVLQSINEVEDEPNVNHEPETVSISSTSSDGKSDSSKRRASKKRSKNEVDGISSPEVDKRQKRNASVKAQSIISKQVNVNLTQKLRRDESNEKDKSETLTVSKMKGKENVEPNSLPVVNIKQEKISLPQEPEQMEMESLPLNVEIKTEINKDDLAMPPPSAPVPKPRKNIPKEKPQPVTDSDEETSSKRQTRNKKTTQSETSAPPTRSSTRVTKTETEETIQPEPRPKRTRAKKKVSDAAKETETTQSSQESAPASPAEKPRPKRTRRGQKAIEKEQQKEPDPLPKETPPEVTSPILQKNTTKHETSTQNVTKNESTVVITKLTQKELKQYQNDAEDVPTTKNVEKLTKKTDKALTKTKSQEEIVKTKNGEVTKIEAVEETMAKTSAKSTKKDEHILNETHVISNGIEMDKTMVIPNGVYNHAPDSPKDKRNMNETVVIERNDQTMIIDKPNNIAMDATVVIDKGPKANLTEDDSLLTDDSDSEPHTPIKQIPTEQPTSAVKEKVQQFEEMASRVTRTKTRAMAKKDDEPETQTPPDKVIKHVLSSDTLTKMNNMIFNGKPPQVSSSASKLQVGPKHSTSVQSSASKVSYNRQREEDIKREDARRKKEAMLEAKRELQKRKREEKMAAAAAARLAAQQERKLAEEAAAKERREKQHMLDIGKIARLKLIEQKKAELARKVAITEERRKQEEQARLQRLQEEQNRALQHRNNQLLEHQAAKREEARMAKEIEKKQREYIEKQKKQREDKLHTFKTPSTPLRVPVEAVYMSDGFQYLNSDEEAEPVDRPIPPWSTSMARKAQLMIQSNISSVHIDRLFSVSLYSPDLAEMFPGIERARLKRTSSAVWRTPPKLPTVAE